MSIYAANTMNVMKLRIDHAREAYDIPHDILSDMTIQLIFNALIWASDATVEYALRDEMRHVTETRTVAALRRMIMRAALVEGPSVLSCDEIDVIIRASRMLPIQQTITNVQLAEDYLLNASE